MDDVQSEPSTFLDGSGAVLASAATPEKKSPWGLRAGLMAATLAVAGAGTFAVTSALARPAGPESPEEAVTLFFEALNNEDVLGMTEVMLASERASLVEPGLAIFSELQRLGVVDQGADLGQLPYLDIRIDELELVTTPVTDGLAVVETTGGTVAASGSGAVPWGEKLDVSSGAWEKEAVAMNEDPVEIAVIEENGSWYVSLYYSIAEAARREMGGAAPALGAGPAPVGAESPEAAVEALMNGMIALDAEGVLTVLDPDEARVLYDYSYLFMDDLEARVNGLRGGLETMNFEELEVSSADVDGRTVATIEGFSFRTGGPEEDLTASFDGDCMRIEAREPMQREFCRHELDEQMSAMGLVGAGESLSTGLTVVEREGRWYVSPVSSVLWGCRDLLVTMDPGDVDALIGELGQVSADPFGLLGLSGLGGSGSEAESIGPSIARDPQEDDDLGDDSAFETEAWPIDPAVVPEGADSLGGDPSFGELSFLVDIDPTRTIATDIFDGGGGFVSVITMPDASHIGGAVRAAEQDWGHTIVTDPEGLPAGVVMIDMGGGGALYLYENYAVRTHVSEDEALAIRVLTRISTGG